MAEPMWRSPAMQRLQNELFTDRDEKIRQNICYRCGLAAKSEDFHNERERREFSITGLCGPCQRIVDSEGEEDEEDTEEGLIGDACDPITTSNNETTTEEDGDE